VLTDIAHQKFDHATLSFSLPIEEYFQETGKQRENGGNVILFRSIDSVGSHLRRAMNLVDWLRTSADERVLSGRRAVVICVMGCLRGLVVLH